MQTSDALTVLFRHNLWANLSLLDLCATLGEEQLDATLIGTFGSIRDTLQHIVRAERSYFSRISTGQPYRTPEGAPPLTFAEMSDELRHSGEGFIEWAPQIRPEESVAVDWDGTQRPVPKMVLLTQAINHATEHRAQIMAILTQLGIEPPELSGWEYYGSVAGY
jgi:uncharacterized damage-inducible protein DinB